MKQSTAKLNKFGEKLAYILTVKEWSQKQLAEILGTSQQCISRWVNGNREPSLDDVLLVCNILDEDPNELLGFNYIPAECYNNYVNIAKRIK